MNGPRNPPHAPLTHEQLDYLKQSLRPLIEKIVADAVGQCFDLPLTISQVADKLHVSPKTVYQWKGKNILRFKKVNGRYFISLQDLNHQLCAYSKHRS